MSEPHDPMTVSVADAEHPVVLALDVGSTGTRAGLYDARGRMVNGCRGKARHQFTTVADGTSTIDPDAVTAEIESCIDATLTDFDGPVAGVALDTFASSLVAVDAAGAALTPCYTYADSRSSAQVQYLKSILNEDDTQQRTGTRQHTGYLPARFLWLEQNHPDIWGRTERWLSLGEYVWLKLLGTSAAGTSTAAWTGMLNRFEGTWDAALCDLVGVDQSRLSPIAAPSSPLRPDTGYVARRWPALADAVWFAPIADGFSSSLGSGSTGADQVVLAAATSGALRVLVSGDVPNLPRGLWCNRVDADRSLLGGALNDVGRTVTWLNDTLRLPEADAVSAAMTSDPPRGLPLVLPFLSGERSTGWVGESRAVFHRVNAATTPLDLYRATLEGVAWTYHRILQQLVQVAGRPREIIGTGRVSGAQPGLLQMVADFSGLPVTPIALKRSTLHGTALHALEVLDAGGERTPVPHGEPLQPEASRYTYYQRRAERYQVLYDKVIAHAN